MPTSRLELLLASFENTLKTITAANGYQTDVKLVSQWEDVPDQLNKFPAVLYEPVFYDFDEEAFHTKTITTLNMRVTVVLEGWSQQRLRVHNAISDVRKALWAKFVANEFDGLAVRFFTGRAVPFMDTRWSSEVCGAEIVCTLDFEETLLDPYSPP